MWIITARKRRNDLGNGARGHGIAEITEGVLNSVTHIFFTTSRRPAKSKSPRGMHATCTNEGKVKVFWPLQSRLCSPARTGVWCNTSARSSLDFNTTPARFSRSFGSPLWSAAGARQFLVVTMSQAQDNFQSSGTADGTSIKSLGAEGKKVFLVEASRSAIFKA